MKSKIDNTWKERVEDVQKELAEIRQQTAQFHQSKQEILRQNNKYAEDYKTEKAKILSQNDAFKAEAARITEQLESAQSRRSEAEKILRECDSYYQSTLIPLTANAKRVEQDLKNKEIPAEALQRESADWAQEEEALRSEMRTIEKEIIEQRRSASKAVAAAEEEARKAEGDLHEAKMARNPNEGKQRFVFSDSVVSQYSDILKYSDDQEGDNSENSRMRKGRAASGRILLQPVDGNQQQPTKSALKKSSKNNSRANSNNNSHHHSHHQNHQQQHLAEDSVDVSAE